MARYGSEAIAGYAYSSHQGLVNRNFTQALFHALGATRVNAGAVCDTCCGEAWELTVGAAGARSLSASRTPTSLSPGEPIWIAPTCIRFRSLIWPGAKGSTGGDRCLAHPSRAPG